MRLVVAVSALRYPASSCHRKGGGETAGRTHSSDIPATPYTKLTPDPPRVEHVLGEPPPCLGAWKQLGRSSGDQTRDGDTRNRPSFQDEVPDGSLTASVIDG